MTPFARLLSLLVAGSGMTAVAQVPDGVSAGSPPVSATAGPFVATSQGDSDEGDSDEGDNGLSPWSGMVTGLVSERRGRARLNPGNTARMPRGIYELGAVLDYQSADFTARLRASTVARDIPHGTGNPREHDGRIDLLQLNWTHALTTDWTLSLGRMNLSFDDGQSFHPLDFFEDTVRGSDFEDRTGRNRGFPLVMLQRATSTGGLRLVYSDDGITNTDYVYGDVNPHFNRGYRQALLSWRLSRGDWTWTTLAQRSWPGHTGLGGSFSWVPTAAWSVYGAAFGARGNPVPVHRNVANGRGSGLDGRDVYINTSPIGTWQADAGRWRYRWLLGTQYTWEGGNSLQVELWHDGRGMSQDEFRTWQGVVGFHDGLSSLPGRRINLGYDLEGLRTPSGTHLFTRYSHALSNGSTLQASILLAQDASGSAALRWQGPRWAAGDLSVEAWRRFGSVDSRYGAVPDRQGMTLIWRTLF